MLKYSIHFFLRFSQTYYLFFPHFFPPKCHPLFPSVHETSFCFDFDKKRGSKVNVPNRCEVKVMCKISAAKSTSHRMRNVDLWTLFDGTKLELYKGYATFMDSGFRVARFVAVINFKALLCGSFFWILARFH